MTRLDRQMHDILNADFVDDRDKWLTYRQVLQKYLRKLPVEDETDSDFKKSETKNTSEPCVSDEKILETVPAKFKTRAKNLLDFARNISSIEWDDKGIVKVNGKEIKGNITDLVNDAVRHRKTFEADGRKYFSTALRRAGIPHELVGNNQFWREGSFANNSAINNLSYRDTTRSFETSQSSASEASPLSVGNEPSASTHTPIIRRSLFNTTVSRRASKKRPLEQSIALNRTRVQKRRCIFQPSKKKYGGSWKKI